MLKKILNIKKSILVCNDTDFNSDIDNEFHFSAFVFLQNKRLNVLISVKDIVGGHFF